MATLIRKNWVAEAARAINKKVGASLADCMQETKDEAIFEPAAIALLTSGDPSQAIDTIIVNVRSALQKQLQSMPPGPEHDDVDNKLYIEMLVRMVAASAVYRYHLQKVGSQAPTSSSAAVATSEPTAANASSKYVEGLLFAFESMQEVHMLDRSQYATAKLSKAQLSSSAATPGWDTVPLMTLVHMIQHAAQQAGSAVDEEALNSLVRGWRKLLIFLKTSDNGVASEFSRRRGALAVVNGLLIMLFQHNNTHQCRVLLQSVEQEEKIADTTQNLTKSVLRPAAHMIAEVIKFRYYQGRLKLYEKKFSEAFDSFSTAYRLTPPFHQCSPPQHENKLRIHFFLLTTGIASGQEPPKQVLEADSLTRHIFQPIIEAVRAGNPVAFARALERNSSTLRRRGVYMLLQQARVLCYLYLLQRVHALVSEVPGADNTKISIPLLVDAAKVIMNGSSSGATDVADAEEERNAKKARTEGGADSLDVDAMCLWVARLISRGFVRGYVSYEHKTLVVSKQMPFPTIAPTQ